MDTINLIITKKNISEEDIRSIKKFKNKLELKTIIMNEDAFDLKKHNKNFGKYIFITMM